VGKELKVHSLFEKKPRLILQQNHKNTQKKKKRLQHVKNKTTFAELFTKRPVFNAGVYRNHACRLFLYLQA